MKKRKSHSDRVEPTPRHKKLSWPGLKAKDHLSRVVTRAVKDARETRENEVWAENQIARVLNYVSPETAMRLLFREAHRRRKTIPWFANTALEPIACPSFSRRRVSSSSPDVIEFFGYLIGASGRCIDFNLHEVFFAKSVPNRGINTEDARRDGQRSRERRARRRVC
jgi:hypothetical protein